MLSKYLKNTVNANWNSYGKSQTEQLHHAVLGLTEEAGEVAGLLKKAYHYGEDNPRKITTKNFEDELGDVLYYWCKVAELCGLEPEDIIKANKKKLKERHENGFDGAYKK